MVTRWTFNPLASWLLFVGAMVCSQVDLMADSNDGAKLYQSTIKPLLSKKCYSCHGSLAQKSSLRLDTVESMLQGGDSGAAIARGDANASEIFSRIKTEDKSIRMPPEGEPLSSSEIESIEKWIAAGAVGPVDEVPEPDVRQHWAFQPIRDRGIPEHSGRYFTNPIDAFLSVGLESKGIQPLGKADKETLLRRVTMDLIGLPPTVRELEDFLRDDSTNAYERVVERLLCRPEYGERWGRHWMDVWRYSDWYGRRNVPDVMNSYPQIWRWRDWIVESLNQDLGYDEMIRQMLAADEIYPGDDTKVVATGFLVRNWFKWNYESWMKDNVEHTGKAFLGLTLHCAHCHDHKYDPISQKDYFRFRAFFEPLELRQDRVEGQPNPGPFRKYVYTESYGPIKSGLVRVFDEKLEAKTYMYHGGDARNRVEGVEPIAPDIPSLFGSIDGSIQAIPLPPEAYYPGLHEFVRREERDKLKSDLQNVKAQLEAAIQSHAEKTAAWNRVLSTSLEPSETDGNKVRLKTDLGISEATVRVKRQAVVSAQAMLDSLEARMMADDAKYLGKGNRDALSQLASDCERQAAYQWTILQEQTAELETLQAEQEVAALLASTPNDAKAIDGAKSKVAKAIQRLADSRAALDKSRSASVSSSQEYSSLAPTYPATSTGRRKALAQWITDPSNPLTGRVGINHIWARHFGQALVDSVADFGRNGKSPTHPELLDWLASEWMRQGWRMKPIHRLMVTSDAYRRASTLRGVDQQLSIDRDNRWYWRFRSRRLESEVIRDSLLATSGELNTARGGPEIEIDQWMNTKRRSIYLSSHGESKVQFLDLFDGANVCDCYMRTTSVRPQQSLALANSDLAWHNARALARRLSDTFPATEEHHFIVEVFKVVLGRSPKSEELDLSLRFLEEQIKILSNSSQWASDKKLAEGFLAPATDPQWRTRETFVHSLFNHHEFVTLR